MWRSDPANRAILGPSVTVQDVRETAATEQEGHDHRAKVNPARWGIISRCDRQSTSMDWSFGNFNRIIWQIKRWRHGWTDEVDRLRCRRSAGPWRPVAEAVHALRRETDEAVALVLDAHGRRCVPQPTRNGRSCVPTLPRGGGRTLSGSNRAASRAITAAPRAVPSSRTCRTDPLRGREPRIGYHGRGLVRPCLRPRLGAAETLRSTLCATAVEGRDRTATVRPPCGHRWLRESCVSAAGFTSRRGRNPAPRRRAPPGSGCARRACA